MECVKHRPRNQKKNKIWMSWTGHCSFTHMGTHWYLWCCCSWKPKTPGKRPSLCEIFQCATWHILGLYTHKVRRVLWWFGNFSLPLSRNDFVFLVWNITGVTLGQLLHITFLSLGLMSAKISVQALSRLYLVLLYDTVIGKTWVRHVPKVRRGWSQRYLQG